MNESLLKVENIETYYGPIMAIRGVSFEVKKGSIVTILGSNGAAAVGWVCERKVRAADARARGRA